MRTRTELRHGYRTLPTEDTTAAVFTNQRTRLNFDFKSKKLDFFASLQDTRQWGQQDPRAGQTVASPTESTVYPLYMFEVYAEPHFSDKFSARIGRQRLIYDNQRLLPKTIGAFPATLMMPSDSYIIIKSILPRNSLAPITSLVKTLWQ